MKKIILLLLLAAILTGCSSQKTIEPTVDSNSSAQSVKEETTMQSTSEAETNSQAAITPEVETSNNEPLNTSEFIIKEGIGIGDIVIGKSNFNDAIKEFGDKYKLIEGNDGYSKIQYET